VSGAREEMIENYKLRKADHCPLARSLPEKSQVLRRPAPVQVRGSLAVGRAVRCDPATPKDHAICLKGDFTGRDYKNNAEKDGRGRPLFPSGRRRAFHARRSSNPTTRSPSLTPTSPAAQEGTSPSSVRCPRLPRFGHRGDRSIGHDLPRAKEKSPRHPRLTPNARSAASSSEMDALLRGFIRRIWVIRNRNSITDRMLSWIIGAGRRDLRRDLRC